MAAYRVPGSTNGKISIGSAGSNIGLPEASASSRLRGLFRTIRPRASTQTPAAGVVLQNLVPEGFTLQKAASCELRAFKSSPPLRTPFCFSYRIISSGERGFPIFIPRFLDSWSQCLPALFSSPAAESGYSVARVSCPPSARDLACLEGDS